MAKSENCFGQNRISQSCTELSRIFDLSAHRRKRVEQFIEPLFAYETDQNGSTALKMSVPTVAELAA